MSFQLVLLLAAVYLTHLCLAKSNGNITTTPLPSDWELSSRYILDWSVWCKFQPDGFDCSKLGSAPVHRFYYDIKMEDCKTHAFGNCLYNYNQFATITQCHDVCREAGVKAISRPNMTAKVTCRLQPDFGTCNDYYPMWYYDMSTRNCKGFSYSGCGGNHNRFPTAEICSAVCSATLWPQ